MTLAKTSAANIVLRVALSLFLIAAGILTLQLDGGLLSNAKVAFGDNEIAKAIHNLIKGSDLRGLRNFVVIVMGILELVAGVFIILSFFVDVGKVNKVALLAILIMWIVVIALVDILGDGGLLNGAFSSLKAFLSFLKVFSAHLLVLGAILVSME